MNPESISARVVIGIIGLVIMIADVLYFVATRKRSNERTTIATRTTRRLETLDRVRVLCVSVALGSIGVAGLGMSIGLSPWIPIVLMPVGFSGAVLSIVLQTVISWKKARESQHSAGR